ncbi:hypothetical protein [Microvirga makkahensis]|uniref:Uncharacterized protein n=1 Tax=Microvirga makkahensis TaxID=1128670 RepID=A0A7X3SMJ6_9HYPH|nr:hypothetical protein [Microvirga makkahensis]MXQ10442.1 hypothetical protein [Microvirga makkahensis]
MKRPTGGCRHYQEHLVELKPNVCWEVKGLIECLELFEDQRTADLIKELVDEALEEITNCDPFVQPHGSGDRYHDTPEFELDVHSLEVKVKVGCSWGDWAELLQRHRLDWVLNPYGKDDLDPGFAAEIEDIKEEIEEDGSAPECDRLQEVWDRLPDHIQMAVDTGISEEEWRLSDQYEVRESLVTSISDFVRDTVSDWDQELKSLFSRAEIVLIDRASGFVCGRGMDVARAVHDLTQGVAHPELRIANPPDLSLGRAILTAYRVPEGIDFDPEDADLVYRWGKSEGSYSLVVAEIA